MAGLTETLRGLTIWYLHMSACLSQLTRRDRGLLLRGDDLLTRTSQVYRCCPISRRASLSLTSATMTHLAKTLYMIATRRVWPPSNTYFELKKAWTKSHRKVFRVTFCKVISYTQIKETRIEFCMRTLQQAQRTKRRWDLWRQIPRSTVDSSR